MITMAFRDLTGQLFGRLTAEAPCCKLSASKTQWGTGKIYWACSCKCGALEEPFVVSLTNLTSGNTRSCGCLNLESLQGRKKHGMAGTYIYGVWQGMKRRCYNPKDKRFDSYGGRGIKVCPEWLEFENFYADMGDPPGEGYSLERKEVNSDYSPSNCKWATPVEQARNTTINHLIEINGETLCLADWLDRYSLKRTTYYKRLERGWTEVEAITREKQIQAHTR